ncbi:unnamed protein product [Rotaria sordida]|uniref:Uncharacterized protein n=1 Tax=Rotaria sordida TaxID=392033 RepID=A0A813Z0W4_9BILA|nr:unnamed protein product [Rotaria sordida]CAF0828158.1 unnamed protein product [Rotaria sordida]CAF0841185.1 unnamed protein product [Rotaria sordida]CAF0891738.1 unnamed protein product [Rotaria sordida]CAF0896197.1 unnamed protein product [Rotaria sordida]
MSQRNTRHVSTNIPSARTTVKSVISTSSQPTVAALSRASNIEFIDYNTIDVARKEIIHKQQEAHRAWITKFDPWLIDEYRQMYDNIAKVHGISRENCLISLKRTEWQQPTNIFPPLHKRLTGQRRRRLLGAFPETENDKIGWRILPQQAIEIYGRAKSVNIKPLPKQYKFSNWPIESFY